MRWLCPPTLSFCVVHASRLIIWGVTEIATDNELSVQAALAEFTALRTEALQAISMEWTIIAFQLTATGVLFSFALTGHSRTGFLLIVPIVSYVLSGRYLRNDASFILIGKYIRNDLSRRALDGLKWETWYKEEGQFPKHIRFLQSLTYGPATFSVISAVSLIWVFPYVFYENRLSAFNDSMLRIVWVLDLTATVISMITMVLTMTFLAKHHQGSQGAKPDTRT
jgi:multisubunit Na+/H+ antiporter MnhC subunit